LESIGDLRVTKRHRFWKTMTTIEKALEEFLNEQERCLKTKTFEEYEDVIDLFEYYLHGFAYVNLNREDNKYYDDLYYKGKGYCEIFGTEHIRATEMRDFFGDFITRKGPETKTFMVTAGKVMQKLIKWMHEKGYMADEEYIESECVIKEFRDEL